MRTVVGTVNDSWRLTVRLMVKLGYKRQQWSNYEADPRPLFKQALGEWRSHSTADTRRVCGP